MLDLFFLFLRTTLKSWKAGALTLRIAIIVGVIFLIISGASAFLMDIGSVDRRTGQTLSLVFFVLGAAIFLFIVAREQLEEEEKSQKKIERVEERAREHPDRPQLAWDLARTKLENYLDRNLSQLRSIFWLTSFVMLVGFGFVLYGLWKAYDNPANFPVSVVASVSGVIISFVGGSFLLIYRSILAQTRRYVSVLERINAVGMAVQVLGAISEESKELKNQSTAALAKQLINLYSTTSHIDEPFDEEFNPSPPRAAQRKRQRLRTKEKSDDVV